MKIVGNKFTLNRVALFKVILFVMLALLGLYNNANILERINNISLFSIEEYFLGLTIGEMGVCCNSLAKIKISN